MQTKVEKAEPQRASPGSPKKKEKELQRSSSIKSPGRKEKVVDLPTQSVLDVNQSTNAHARRKEKVKQGRSGGG